MKNPQQLLLFHNLASSYHCRPSSYIELPPKSWEAFLFDAACLLAYQHDVDKPKDERGVPLPKDKNPWLSMFNKEVKVINDPNFNGIW